MATHDLLLCNKYLPVGNDYYNIRKFIECVFDDGDLSDVDFGGGGSDCLDQPCDKIVFFGLEDDSAMVDNFVPLVSSKQCETVLQSEISPLSMTDKTADSITISNSKPDEPTSNDELPKLVRTDKVKFSLKPKTTVLKQTQMCLDEPETSKVQLFMPSPISECDAKDDKQADNTLNVENKSSESSCISRIGGEGKRIDRNSSIRRSYSRGSSMSSSSSSSSTSSQSAMEKKYKSSGHKSKQNSTQRKSYSSRKSLKKSPERSSKKHKRSSKSYKEKTSKLVERRSKRTRSSSSESRRIIAAQFHPSRSDNAKKSKTKGSRIKSREKSFGDEGNNESRVGTCDKKLAIKEGRKRKRVSDEELPVSCDLVRKKAVCTSASLANHSEVHQEGKNSSALHSNCERLQEKCSMKKKRRESNSETDFKQIPSNGRDLWNLDPLLINAIPTNDDLILSHERVRDYRRSPSSRNEAPASKVGSSSSEKTDLVNADSEGEGPVEGPRSRGDENLCLIGKSEVGGCPDECPVDSNAAGKAKGESFKRSLEEAVNSITSVDGLYSCCQMVLKRSQSLLDVGHLRRHPRINILVKVLEKLAEFDVKCEEICASRPAGSFSPENASNTF